MEVFEYSYGKKLDLPPSLLVLGFFDGVTSAHRELIREAHSLAEKRGLPLGIFTFPQENPIKQDIPRIYSTDEKLLLLERTGADFTILADFMSLSSLTPREFVTDVLIRDAGCEACASGFNFKFGYKAQGDASALKRLMNEAGKEAFIEEELCDGGVTVSSTLIRKCLTECDIEHAERLLGAPFMLKGQVTRGLKAGKSMGFPTVNTCIPAGRATPLGVFRSAVPIEDKIYHAVTNIGSCPTLGAREIHAETHILGYRGDLYGRELEIYLLGFLRDEVKFDSREALIAQVEKDKIKAIKENGELSWQRLGLK